MMAYNTQYWVETRHWGRERRSRRPHAVTVCSRECRKDIHGCHQRPAIATATAPPPSHCITHYTCTYHETDRLRTRNASNTYFAKERTVLSLFVFNNSIHLNIEGLTLKYVGKYCRLISWYLGHSSRKWNSSSSLWHMVQILDSYGITGLSHLPVSTRSRWLLVIRRASALRWDLLWILSSCS